MLPVHLLWPPVRSALLAAMFLSACGGAEGAGPTTDHPVPGGRWPPTTGDAWPTLAQALNYTGCRAYGGVAVAGIELEPVFAEVLGVALLDDEGLPVIVVNPSLRSHPVESRAFLYFHECAHHLVQDPAYRAVDQPPEPVLSEYQANCLAAVELLSTGAFVRRDIDFILLVLENNSGPDRPPGQGAALIACLRQRGLY